jgi:predicted ATPase
VAFADLAPVSDPAAVAVTVAVALTRALGLAAPFTVAAEDQLLACGNRIWRDGVKRIHYAW